MLKKLPRYLTTEKRVGETPLVALERLRATCGIPSTVPLAYAGRLDPMASGKLLILMGDECKVQEKYHAFDKEYEVEILLGLSSDSSDVLGIISQCEKNILNESQVLTVLKSCNGKIRLPYPHFSSKTVRGKPLHTWTLEGRIAEIDIPVKESTIHKITLTGIRTITKKEMLITVRAKIETIPEVTDPKKALGADFRRDAVRAAWKTIEETGDETYQILSFTCIASSGTYMRSLGEHIAHKLDTCGLAYSIHRKKIGKYRAIIQRLGVWTTRF